MNPDQKKFLTLMAFNAFIVFGFFMYKYLILLQGTEILLELAEPIDPVDLFRGNYVILTYTIGTINPANITHDYEFDYDDTVYAVLTQKDKYWSVDALAHSKPNIGEGQVCMKGKVSSVRSGTVRIRWGIENYFAPPDIAKKIDQNKWTGNVDSIVVVDSSCNVILKSLIVDGLEIRTS